MTEDKDEIKKRFLLDAVGSDPAEELRGFLSTAPASAREPILREQLRRQFKSKGRR